jgi:hypothetical protein
MITIRCCIIPQKSAEFIYSKSLIHLNYIQGSENNCKISSQLKHRIMPFMGHKVAHLAISDGQPAQEGIQPCPHIPERNTN